MWRQCSWYCYKNTWQHRARGNACYHHVVWCRNIVRQGISNLEAWLAGTPFFRNFSLQEGYVTYWHLRHDLHVLQWGCSMEITDSMCPTYSWMILIPFGRTKTPVLCTNTIFEFWLTHRQGDATKSQTRSHFANATQKVGVNSNCRLPAQ